MTLQLNSYFGYDTAFRISRCFYSFWFLISCTINLRFRNHCRDKRLAVRMLMVEGRAFICAYEVYFSS